MLSCQEESSSQKQINPLQMQHRQTKDKPVPSHQLICKRKQLSLQGTRSPTVS